jgi:hypothetical protein
MRASSCHHGLKCWRRCGVLALANWRAPPWPLLVLPRQQGQATMPSQAALLPLRESPSSARRLLSCTHRPQARRCCQPPARSSSSSSAYSEAVRCSASETSASPNERSTCLNARISGVGHQPVELPGGSVASTTRALLKTCADACLLRHNRMADIHTPATHTTPSNFVLVRQAQTSTVPLSESVRLVIL